MDGSGAKKEKKKKLHSSLHPGGEKKKELDLGNFDVRSQGVHRFWGGGGKRLNTKTIQLGKIHDNLKET